MKIIYEHSEPFRAGILEKIGFALCSPFCLVWLNLILNGFVFNVKIVIGLIVSSLLFILGAIVILQAYFGMCYLDLAIRRTND